MNEIKKADLELLTNDEIREFMNSKNFKKDAPELIKTYVLNDEGLIKVDELWKVTDLLNNIIVERFLKQKPLYGFLVNCEAVNTVGELKEILNNFDDGDIVVVEDEDLFPFYVDVITGMELTTGGTREIRFTKIEHEDLD